MLNNEARLPYIDDLVRRKLGGPEKSRLSDADLAFHRGEFERLEGVLKAAGDASPLPEAPSAMEGLSELLVRLRLGT